MSGTMPRLLGSLVLIALAGGVAVAKPAVAVLGLEVTGEVDQPATVAARDLTAGLRARARMASGPYQLAPNSQRELIDEKVLGDCADEAPACMATIGRGLRAAVLVYGRLQKDEGGGYQVSLIALDVDNKVVLARHAVQVPAGARGPRLRGIARSAYAELVRGIGSSATLVVTANIDRGTVLVDDEVQQELKQGRARLSLPPGRYRIAIEADGYRRQEITVTLDGAGTMTESLTLSRTAGEGDTSGGFDPWKPTFVIAAAATAGLAIYSTQAFVRMKGLESELPAGSGVEDCTPGVTGKLEEACSLQSQHAMTAYAAIGAGALMLVSGYFTYFHDKGGAERAPAGRAVAVTPHVAPGGGGATLQVTW